MNRMIQIKGIFKGFNTSILPELNCLPSTYSQLGTHCFFIFNNRMTYPFIHPATLCLQNSSLFSQFNGENRHRQRLTICGDELNGSLGSHSSYSQVNEHLKRGLRELCDSFGWVGAWICTAWLFITFAVKACMPVKAFLRGNSLNLHSSLDRCEYCVYEGGCVWGVGR